MKDNTVRVFLWDNEICRIQWKGGYRTHFGRIGSLVSFNPQYRNFGFDVDPLGPYSLSSYMVQKGMSDVCRATEYEGLPRFLSASLPDDWGNLVFSSWMRNNRIGRGSVTPVDKLAFIGKRAMGGFEFVPELYAPSSDDSVVLEQLYSLAKEIEASRSGLVLNMNGNPAVKDLMEVGMSAGGKHPKAIIAMNRETGEVRSGQIPLPDGFTHYILKFKDSAAWPAAEIEFAYYLMARECGIDMETSSLLRVDGVNHFLTERFDRKGGRKIHSATLHSLCGDVTSYEDVFAACRALKLPYHDIDQLFRRAVFNYLACVCDDHDRNFSFIMSEDGKWRLSPAYDETFTVNIVNPLIADRHCMTIGGSSRAISRNRFLGLACQNDVKNASDIISEVAESVMSFESKARQAGVEDRFIEAVMANIRNQSI